MVRFDKSNREKWTQLMDAFVDTVLRPDRPQHRAAYLSAMDASADDTAAVSKKASPRKKVYVAKARAGGLLDFADVDVRLLADAFVVIDFEHMSRIPLEDFHLHMWESARNPEGRTSAIFHSVNRWVLVGDWVATEIVCTPVLRARVNMLRKMIDLASELWVRGDFQSTMAITSALQSAAIDRLKQTWKGLSAASLKKFEALTELCGPRRHFALYREELAKRLERRRAGQGAVIIPFLGLATQELTSLDDSVRDWLSSSVINFAKALTAYKVVGHFYRCLSGSLGLLPTPSPEILPFAVRLSDPLAEEQLYRMSLSLERFVE